MREVMVLIDECATGIALVVTLDRRLLGTITDGDIRRALLAGVDLDGSLRILLAAKASSPYPTPITAPVGTPDAELLRMMNDAGIRHIPVLDEAGHVVTLVLLDELLKEYELPLRAVVMAGGFGTRLGPLSQGMPKPMLPVGDRPLLEHIVDQLRQAGIRRVHLATHYCAEAISSHFGSGDGFGLEIDYVEEDRPLGTAGALARIEGGASPVLVINGDILTKLNVRAMLDFHRESKADMTVAVRDYEYQIPFGVVESDGIRIVKVSEKPVVRHFINAGIYLVNPDVCSLVPSDEAYDMPELIGRLVDDGRRVVSFPLHEYWKDIGQAEDYERAVEDVRKGAV